MSEPAPQVVYVVSRDDGYTGYGRPEIAFETKYDAERFVEQSRSADSQDWDITEVPIFGASAASLFKAEQSS